MNIKLPDEDSKTIDVDVQKEKVRSRTNGDHICDPLTTGAAVLPPVQVLCLLEQTCQGWAGQGCVGGGEVLP